MIATLLSLPASSLYLSHCHTNSVSFLALLQRLLRSRHYLYRYKEGCTHTDIPFIHCLYTPTGTRTT